MGVEKTCKVCKEQFTTTSFKSATTINMCDKCYGAKKRTQAELNIVASFNNKIVAVETRLSKLEKAIEMIPILIGAEISNALTNITEAEMLSTIKKGIQLEHNKRDKKMKSEHNKRIKEIDNFKVKLQKQIVTLNNKIINIIKEMD